MFDILELSLTEPPPDHELGLSLSEAYVLPRSGYDFLHVTNVEEYNT